MGHHTEDIACLITNTCYISQATVGVGVVDDASLLIAVAIDHLVIRFQFVEGFLVCILTAFAMGDGNLKRLFFIAFPAQENIL